MPVEEPCCVEEPRVDAKAIYSLQPRASHSGICNGAYALSTGTGVSWVGDLNMSIYNMYKHCRITEKSDTRLTGVSFTKVGARSGDSFVNGWLKDPWGSLP